MNDVKTIPLQKSFSQDYVKWTILKRTGNLILAELKPITGKIRWDVCWIRPEPDKDVIIERVAPSHSFDGTDPKSDCFSLEKMQVHFDRILVENEKIIERKKNEAEEKKAFLKANNLWMDKLAIARSEQSSLILELKQLNKNTEDLRFFEDKRVVKILDSLARLEQFCHHGKSI